MMMMMMLMTTMMMMMMMTMMMVMMLSPPGCDAFPMAPASGCLANNACCMMLLLFGRQRPSFFVSSRCNVAIDYHDFSLE
jgi:hypothetical protein